MSVALVHDYLTQRGGAERVVASLARAFPQAPLHTSLYHPEGTFADFHDADVITLPLNRVPLFRRNHRLALPLLARAFSSLEVDADAAVCSSSGWAHGANVRGRKIVYCYTPARWLYQADRYLGATSSRAARTALALRRRSLERWDLQAAASASRYLAISTVVRERIRTTYGRDAELVPPPHTIDPGAPRQAPDGLEPGFLLCVSRLLAYKNVDAVVEAFAELPGLRLVVAGSGPEEARLRALAPANVEILGNVEEAELRWLYAECSGLIAASYEDFGLTPLEAAAFGKPSATLRFGGFLDTVRELETGIFFDLPEPAEIRAAVRALQGASWDDAAIRRRAESFSEKRFVERIRAIVAEEERQGPERGGERTAARARR